MSVDLLEGSEALAKAMISAGCRFFAGYPMTPFTELLEGFAKKLPGVGGVCINAESELEAIGMAWGALATGARAATGSTGQGLALMQESLSEITRAELPLVVFNLARGQAEGHYPREAMDALHVRGLPQMFGPGATAWHVNALLAELAAVDGSLAITVGVNALALLPIHLDATPDLRARVFSRVEAGDMAAMLLTEWAHGSDHCNIGLPLHP